MPDKLIDSNCGSCMDPLPVWLQAQHILEEEANQLAQWLEDKSREKVLPRVELAVRREIKRLRSIATELRP